MRRLNTLAREIALGTVCDLSQAIAEGKLKGIPTQKVIKNFMNNNGDRFTQAITLHGVALASFYSLVKNGAIWDFKDEIGNKLGPGITLCGNSNCYYNIEFSVPGNIHFGYIGVAAGFLGAEIQAGAGFAQITDPSGNPNSEEYITDYVPPNIFQILGWTPWDLSTINYGDEPTDHEAVTMGIKLYSANNQMTLSQFKREIDRKALKFSKCSNDPDPVDPKIAANWPYPLGYFNNKGQPYVLPAGRCQ